MSLDSLILIGITAIVNVAATLAVVRVELRQLRENDAHAFKRIERLEAGHFAAADRKPGGR